MKKAQISFNYIVAAIIAVAILVLIVLFATGALTTLFGSTETIAGSTDADIVAAKNRCSTYCISAQGSDNQANSDFCTKAFGFDLNGDGEISDDETPELGIGNVCLNPDDATNTDESDEVVCCNEAPINANCPGVSCEAVL